MTHTIFFPSTPEQNAALVEWAAGKIPWLKPHGSFRAVGVVEGATLAHPLLAVCLYHGYAEPMQIDGKTWHATCEISFAASSPKWATRRTISTLIGIPFLQYNCRKVWTAIPSTNKRATRLNEGLGLKPEGTLRHHFAKGVHACIHGMLRSEFDARWRNPPTGRKRSDLGTQVNRSHAPTPAAV